MSKYNLPIFATSTYENIQPNIDSGIINNFGYVYVKDTGELAFIDKKLKINLIKGDNTDYIQIVDALDPDTADETVLYLLDGVYYRWDGEKYEPLFKSIDDKIDVINTALVEINEYIIHNDLNISEINEKIDNIGTDIENISEDIQDAIDTSKSYTEELLTITEFTGIVDNDQDEDVSSDYPTPVDDDF